MTQKIFYLMNHDERLLSTPRVCDTPSCIRKAMTFRSQVHCRKAHLKGRIQRPVLLLWRMTACGLRDALPSNCQTFTVSSRDREATLLEPAAGNWLLTGLHATQAESILLCRHCLNKR